MKIGVISESFRKPFPETVRAARALGADGIQAYAGKAFPCGEKGFLFMLFL